MENKENHFININGMRVRRSAISSYNKVSHSLIIVIAGTVYKFFSCDLDLTDPCIVDKYMDRLDKIFNTEFLLDGNNGTKSEPKSEKDNTNGLTKEA